MKITVIDGQGGRIGRTVIEQLKKKHETLELYAIGTNSGGGAVGLSIVTGRPVCPFTTITENSIVSAAMPEEMSSTWCKDF